MFKYIVFLLVLHSPLAYSIDNEKYLFQWDQGDGAIFPNWEWNSDIGYGVGAYILIDDPVLGITGESFLNGLGPRSMNKTDYGRNNTGTIDISTVSPGSDPLGGSFHVKADDNIGDNRSTWWIWYDGRNLSQRGVTNANTDRMSFYVKLEGTGFVSDSGTLPSSTFEVGTYLCWQGEGTSYGSGDGCPYEGPGNRHYYHWMSINPDTWVHVLVDQHPQHLRGASSSPENNPAQNAGKNYFENLSQFYMQQSAEAITPTEFWVDEIKFYSTVDDFEPNQNELSVASLWVTHRPNTDNWEIGFNDRHGPIPNNKTYEVKWSTSPITNANWAQANSIIPLINGGVSVTGNANLIRRPNSYKGQVYTKFQIPDNIETPGATLHFAVKDVSAIGQHAGSAYPFNSADDSDSPSALVKTIDYIIEGVNHSNSESGMCV